jgi:hypothetical protein
MGAASTHYAVVAFDTVTTTVTWYDVPGLLPDARAQWQQPSPGALLARRPAGSPGGKS